MHVLSPATVPLDQACSWRPDSRSNRSAVRDRRRRERQAWWPVTTSTIRFRMRRRAVAINLIVARAGSAALHPVVCRPAELFTRSCRI